MATGVKAAVLREINQPLSIETITLDKPAAGEVLVRTAAAGVCHSDFHFMNGSYETPLPSVMGHESAGVVEQVQGRLHLDELISKRIQLQDVNQAFDEMLNGNVARSVIVFDSDS